MQALQGQTLCLDSIGACVQGPSIMRPMQHRPGAPPPQLAGPPSLAPPDAQDHETEHPTAARPGGPLCKFFNTPHVGFSMAAAYSALSPCHNIDMLHYFDCC